MSVTHCALSGKPLKEPVVSKKSGHVFEKSLIIQHLRNTGQCPITGQDLDASQDLLDLSVPTSAQPRPLISNSIPGTLSMLESEWDALMLEVFNLNKNLDSTRKELSHALYQHDAACRVICRLVKEKEELQNMLTMSQQQVEEYKSMLASSLGGPNSQEEQKQYIREEKENEGIYKELVTKMCKLQEQLSKNRKDKQIQKAFAASYPKVEAAKEFKEQGEFPFHEQSNPTVCDIDIHEQNRYIITGGLDQKAVLFDKDSKKIATRFEPFGIKKGKQGHFGVSVARFVPCQNDLYAVLGSLDSTAGLWYLDIEHDSYKPTYLMKSHSAAITGCAFHPLNEYVMLASKDKTWSFHNLFQGVKLAQIEDSDEIHSIDIHPEGLIMATGLKNGTVKLWDLREQKPIQEIQAFPGKAISSLAFNPKAGVFAVASNQDSSAKLFDLRELGPQNMNSQQIDVSFAQGKGVESLSYDLSGNWLSIGVGRSWAVFEYKKYKAPIFCSTEVFEGGGYVKASRFARNGSYICLGGDDRFVKVYGL